MLAEETLQGGVVKQRLEKYTGQSRDWYPRQFIDETLIGVDSQGRAYRSVHKSNRRGACMTWRRETTG